RIPGVSPATGLPIADRGSISPLWSVGRSSSVGRLLSVGRLSSAGPRWWRSPRCTGAFGWRCTPRRMGTPGWCRGLPGYASAAPFGLRRLLDAVGEFGDLVVQRAPLGHLLADLAVGVHHGGVVAAAEGLTDTGQRQVGQLAAQVHGDLAGVDQDPRTGLPAQ